MKEKSMPIINATNARNNFFKLIETALTTHEPVYVTTKSGNVVLLSEEDYRSIQETLYLCSLPGMKEKIIQGIKTPLEDCVECSND
jgi:antitoxin YefM